MSYRLCILVFVFGLFNNNFKLAFSSCQISPACREKIYGNMLFPSGGTIYADDATSSDIFLPEYLLSPITAPYYPLYVIQLKNDLIEYLMKQNYNYPKILEPITQSIAHKSREDIMIETLITLRDLLSNDCAIRSDINAILVYLLQRHRPYDAREDGPIEPIVPPTYSTIPSSTFLSVSPEASDNYLVLPKSNENSYMNANMPSQATSFEPVQIPNTDIGNRNCNKLSCSRMIRLLEKILKKMDEPKQYHIFVDFSKLSQISYSSPTKFAKTIETETSIVDEIQTILFPINDLLQKIYAKLYNINHSSLTQRQGPNYPPNMDFRNPKVDWEFDDFQAITMNDIRTAILPTIHTIGKIYKELTILVAQNYIPGYPIEEPYLDEHKYLTDTTSHEHITSYTILTSLQPVMEYLDKILLILDNVARLNTLYPGKASDFPQFQDLIPTVHKSMYAQRHELTFYDLQNALIPIIDRFTKILATLHRIKPGYKNDTRLIGLFNDLKMFLQRNMGYLEEIRLENLKPLLNAIVQLLKYILEKIDDFKRTVRSTRPFFNDVPTQPIITIVPTTKLPTTIPTTTTTSTTTTTTTTTTPPPPPKFAYLIEKLPKPENEEQKIYYGIISTFLSRADLESLVGNSIDIHAYKNEHDLLKALFGRSITLKLSAAELAAVKYYLEYEVKLARLSLVTHKQIHKQFDLSGIILDTINLHTLTDEQRRAFDEFFQFILNIQSDQMSNFENWTDAKTKGEFMKILFDYFLSASFVPENVKYSIKVIVPTIQMTGAGSQPV